MLGVKHYPASAETQISMQDYQRMGCRNHTVTFLKNSPRWAASDEKLRKVAAHKICNTAGIANVPSTLEELRKVEEIYLKASEVRARAAGADENRKHLETVRRFGGPLAFFTSLLYRRYRLAENSVAIAQHYGITPQNVRQQINRCSLIARAIFPDPEDHLPWHHSATIRKVTLPKPEITPQVFGQRKPAAPKFCVVCGKEVPPYHRKFCNRKCYKKNDCAQKAKREGPVNHRPVFCSVECKVQYITHPQPTLPLS